VGTELSGAVEGNESVWVAEAGIGVEGRVVLNPLQASSGNINKRMSLFIMIGRSHP
jgi:hypothetical protein